MKYFNEDATWTYLMLTEISHDNSLVFENEYIERLFILKQFCDPNDIESIANINLRINFLKEWYGTLEQSPFFYPDDNHEDLKSDNRGEKGEENTDTSFQGDDFDPVLHFITTSAGKISKWEFHKTDSDFFPSIPHGHAIINHKIKLDAYRGYIFINNQLCDRETRRFIIDLWNDNKFRDAARETIVYYMNNFPHYRWRVTNPLRLPRRKL